MDANLILVGLPGIDWDINGGNGFGCRYTTCMFAHVVKFVLLDATTDVLAVRLNVRAAEGKHFMPACLTFAVSVKLASDK
ncbi:Gluconokinase [Quillaja saponaria]|uniref:Gluconokinase n=1 Tax=Quillaja saponaria TaxID=32244 RepID=A0AAD7L1S5_QUISA|nr:Gluconokinase [Quillaja saponaria]